MENFEKKKVNADGVSVDVYVGGEGETCALLIHGGIPGLTPFASGAHIWGQCTELMAATRRVAILDLSSMGCAEWSEAHFSAETAATLAWASLDTISATSAHIVGHDSGALVAMTMALDAPERTNSLSIVASPFSAPTGDTLSNVSFTDPPGAMLSEEAHHWAFDKLLYSDPSIASEVIDAAIAAASRPYFKAVSAIGPEQVASTVTTSLRKAQYRQWEACRGSGIPVPVQVIWGDSDITTSRDAGRTLFRLVANRQPSTQFHVINRAGSLVFLDQPEVFTAIVSAFQDGVDQASKRVAEDAGQPPNPAP